MRSLIMVAVVLCGLVHGEVQASVQCEEVSTAFKCTLSYGANRSADAWGSYDSGEETGWGKLHINAIGSSVKGAYAAGYLEGALTVRRTSNHLYNFRAKYLSNSTVYDGLTQFAEDNLAFMKANIAPRATVFWAEAELILAQMEGLQAGHNAHCDKKDMARKHDIFLLNMQGDISDVLSALFPETRVAWESITDPATAFMHVLDSSHCSAMVKVADDFSELFHAHNMWWPWYSMTRISKEYRLGDQQVAMTSYPATLSSTDDWYQSYHNGLHVMETTNPLFNNKLYDLITPKSVLSFIRVTIANRRATSGKSWEDLFSQYNSGTYNNMWMVTDMTLFTPKADLPPGLFRICEQVPGTIVCSDQTVTLQRGYWPSYNNIFDAHLRDISGINAMEEKFGDYFSYQLNPRAKIMRRDHGKVTDVPALKKLWRYNNFQNEPFAADALGHHWPTFTLAARADLLPENLAPPRADGATDAKCSSFKDFSDGRFNMIYGPTHEDEKPFVWADLNSTEPHRGQPLAFDNFTWTTFEASPAY